MGKIALFILFEGHLGAEGVAIGAWTLYEVREDVRRASQNNCYIDPEVPLITDMTGNDQIMSLKSTIVDHSWIKMSVRC